MGRKGPRIALVEEDEPKPKAAGAFARLYDESIPAGADELCEIAAAAGLDPSGVGAFCRIVAQEGKIALALGYRGVLKLAMDSGEIGFFDARAIYTRDLFALDLGSQYIKHAPYDGEEDPGALTGAWAMLIDRRGMKQIEYVNGRKLAEANGWHQAWMPAEDFARKIAAVRLLQASPMNLMALRYMLDAETRTASGRPIPKIS